MFYKCFSDVNKLKARKYMKLILLFRIKGNVVLSHRIAIINAYAEFSR